MRTASVLASDLSARVETLIRMWHGGDRRAAARHLGIEHKYLLGLLSGDWRRFSLDAIAALVIGYGVRPEWLLRPVSAFGGGPPGPDDASAGAARSDVGRRGARTTPRRGGEVLGRRGDALPRRGAPDESGDDRRASAED